LQHPKKNLYCSHDRAEKAERRKLGVET
jgi:hypothetical protein